MLEAERQALSERAAHTDEQLKRLQGEHSMMSTERRQLDDTIRRQEAQVRPPELFVSRALRLASSSSRELFVSWPFLFDPFSPPPPPHLPTCSSPAHLLLISSPPHTSLPYRSNPFSSSAQRPPHWRSASATCRRSATARRRSARSFRRSSQQTTRAMQVRHASHAITTQTHSLLISSRSRVLVRAQGLRSRHAAQRVPSRPHSMSSSSSAARNVSVTSASKSSNGSATRCSASARGFRSSSQWPLRTHARRVSGSMRSSYARRSSSSRCVLLCNPNHSRLSVIAMRVRTLPVDSTPVRSACVLTPLRSSRRPPRGR